jgi:DNA-binding transcriptional LysR family regulator
MTIPEFLLGPLLVAETDLLLTAPERLLQSFVPLLPVVVVAPPLQLRSFEVSLCWHGRSHDDPAHRWFRELLVEAHQAAYGG